VDELLKYLDCQQNSFAPMLKLFMNQSEEYTSQLLQDYRVKRLLPIQRVLVPSEVRETAKLIASLSQTCRGVMVITHGDADHIGDLQAIYSDHANDALICVIKFLVFKFSILVDKAVV
jgi:hypothetical protein